MEDGSMITYAVEYSYRNSPDMNNSYNAWRVSPSGVVYNVSVNNNVYSSYGRI